jgi:Predicted NTP pyrophosphohydrolase
MKKSAGILMYRRSGDSIEVFLIHPGGPFWAKKDLGAWSIPKGQYEDDEAPLDAARREFREETGFEADGEFIPLPPIKQKSGKVVTAWAVEGQSMRPPSRATCSRSNGRQNQDDTLNSRKRTGPDGFPRPKLVGNSILPSPLLSIPSALTWDFRSLVKNLERVAPFIV